MNSHTHRDGRNDADHDERYGRKQETQVPGPISPKKRGRPPKSRVEVEENEDLEVEEGREEIGGYLDPSRLPVRE